MDEINIDALIDNAGFILGPDGRPAPAHRQLSPEQIALAKQMVEDPDLRAKMYLIQRRIPSDLAEVLTFDEKVQFARAIARIEDSDFNWETMTMTRLRGQSLVFDLSAITQPRDGIEGDSVV